MQILTEVTDDNWQFWEREYIKLYRELGFDLTNTTDGGDMPPSTAGEKNPMFGKKHSPASKEKNRISHIGKSVGEKNGMFGVRRCGKESPFFGKKHAPDTIDKNRLAHIGKRHSPESRAKMSASRTGARNAFFGKKHSLEAREKNRLAHIGKKQSRITVLKRQIAICFNRVLKICQPIE